MAEKAETYINRIKANRYYRIISVAVFAALIVYLSFQSAFRGVDVTDSTYSLTNFKYADKVDGMWFYSTFYANLLGRFFNILPGGSTLLGMKLYTSLIKCMLALGSFFFFARIFKKHNLSVFLGAVSALGMCWCPETILYNYLSYLMFFLGAAAVYEGLEKENKIWLVIAGFILGSNVFVRLPNVVEAGLIVAVWTDALLKKNTFKEGFNKTLWCILGYVISFVPAVLAMAMTRGIGAYIQGIAEMFGVSSKASGYGPTEMIISIIRSFVYVKAMIFLVLLVMIISTALWVLFRKKSEIVCVLLAVIISFFMLIKVYRYGMFTRHYNELSAFFGLGKILLFVIYLYLIIMLFRKDRTVSDKRLAVMAVMIALVTPLGTNNELYATLNNMFFVLPVVWYFVLKDIYERNVFTCIGIDITVLLLALLVQSTLFGTTYSFRDGTNAKMDTASYGNRVTEGVLTTGENALEIAGITEFWENNNLDDGEVLLYGNVCGMGFILDTPFAISTAWPTLESYSEDKFIKDINGLNEYGKTPTVLMDTEAYHRFFDAELSSKQKCLKQFLENNKYNIAYQSDKFVVYVH